jgi:hypothetical protein
MQFIVLRFFLSPLPPGHGYRVKAGRNLWQTLTSCPGGVEIQRDPKVTYLVARSSRASFVSDSRMTRIRRESGAYVTRIMQMLRAPVARGARNQGCYFWTPLYSAPRLHATETRGVSTRTMNHITGRTWTDRHPCPKGSRNTLGRFFFNLLCISLYRFDILVNLCAHPIL